MAVTINADTSNGLVMTPDTSGEIKLQSAGTDIATVDSSGITMASGKKLNATDSILQIVQGSTSTAVSTSSNTNIDTGLTATITPSSTSSKILVIVHQNGITKGGSTSASVELLRDATFLGYLGRNMGYTANSSINYGWGASISYLDSPATTSAITYKTQFLSRQNVASVQVQDASAISTITLMEIAG